MSDYFESLLPVATHPVLPLAVPLAAPPPLSGAAPAGGEADIVEVSEEMNAGEQDFSGLVAETQTGVPRADAGAAPFMVAGGAVGNGGDAPVVVETSVRTPAGPVRRAMPLAEQPDERTGAAAAAEAAAVVRADTGGARVVAKQELPSSLTTQAQRSLASSPGAAEVMAAVNPGEGTDSARVLEAVLAWLGEGERRASTGDRSEPEVAEGEVTAVPAGREKENTAAATAAEVFAAAIPAAVVEAIEQSRAAESTPPNILAVRAAAAAERPQAPEPAAAVRQGSEGPVSVTIGAIHLTVEAPPAPPPPRLPPLSPPPALTRSGPPRRSSLGRRYLT